MDTKKLLKIAHRGFSEKYPENTIIAFDEAINYGADMIELDIHFSKDKKIVVIHDDYIDRTSNGTGAVNDLTLSELKKYNYSNNYSGNFEIPTLEEVIDLVKNRAMLNIEIKNCPIKQHLIEEDLLKLLEKTQFLNEVIISSFDHYSLEKIKKIAPSIKTGMLYDAIWIKFKEEVELLDVYSIHPNIDIVEYNDLKWADERGIKIYPWVSKDKKSFKRLIDMGLIDGIMVNDLNLFNNE